jgi:PLP dependent protein
MTENRLETVLRRIKDTCGATNRDFASVKLLAVSKLHPGGAVRALYAQGQRAFGENYVQEGVDKVAELADLPDIEWHMIGPLQSNKTRDVAENFAWVHTVDREKIAQRLSDQRLTKKTPLNICIQVNVSGEASKSGCAFAEAIPFALRAAKLPRIKVRGFMGMPEPGIGEEATRAQFRALAALIPAAKSQGLLLDTLSMGMSDDMDWAIAEGSTMVRVGTALFGARPVKA